MITSALCAAHSARSAAGAGAMQAVAAAPSAGALERALAAAAAKPASISNASKSGGEFEAADWWEEHAETFALARSEWGRLHPGLYDLAANEADYIDPSLRTAVAAAEAAAMAGGPVDEAPLRSLLKPTGVAGVWRLQLFTPRFCAELREELDHAAASGVPIRRPNGMNRFGAILEAVPGGLGMEGAMRHLAHRYGRPLSQMAFPSSVGLRDADEHYGFVVRYRPGEDESLAEHADASVATINVNLADGFRGGRLTFKGTRFVDADPRNAPAAAVDFEDFAPGEAQSGHRLPREKSRSSRSLPDSSAPPSSLSVGAAPLGWALPRRRADPAGRADQHGALADGRARRRARGTLRAGRAGAHNTAPPVGRRRGLWSVGGAAAGRGWRRGRRPRARRVVGRSG